MKRETVLVIGGSDPSGGAGVQTDIKAITALGLHAAAIPTCTTIQNTQRVKGFSCQKPDLIAQQIDMIMEDMNICFVKIGMLGSSENGSLLAKMIKRFQWKTILDPVLRSSSNDPLSTTESLASLKKELISQSYIFTPNIDEASIITNRSIHTLDDMKDAAEDIISIGAQHVVIKGGHGVQEQVSDVFFDGEKHIVYSLPRIPQKKAHGSGCTFSSLIAGYLALGNPIEKAVQQAKQSLWMMIKRGYTPGKGMDVLDVSSIALAFAPYFCSKPEKFTIWNTLSEAIETIPNLLDPSLVPEVGINVGYALPHAKTPKDICALSGRIIKSSLQITACGVLRFGASHHIAAIILAAMQSDPQLRSAMNIKYSKENLTRCENKGFIISSFDRKNEPVSVSSTMEWGTTQALEHSTAIPDIIYDTGAPGKEPMIRILGTSPQDVIKKLRLIAEK